MSLYNKRNKFSISDLDTKAYHAQIINRLSLKLIDTLKKQEGGKMPLVFLKDKARYNYELVLQAIKNHPHLYLTEINQKDVGKSIALYLPEESTIEEKDFEYYDEDDDQMFENFLNDLED